MIIFPQTRHHCSAVNERKKGRNDPHKWLVALVRTCGEAIISFDFAQKTSVLLWAKPDHLSSATLNPKFSSTFIRTRFFKTQSCHLIRRICNESDGLKYFEQKLIIHFE